MLTINICIGSACHLKGSYQIITLLNEKIKKHNLEEKVSIKGAFCLGHCTKAVSVKINDENVQSVSIDAFEEFFTKEILGRLSQ